MRSKGLLQDFAYGQLGRVREARTRAYSGGGDSTDEEENKDYDMIRGENEVISGLFLWEVRYFHVLVFMSQNFLSTTCAATCIYMFMNI